MTKAEKTKKDIILKSAEVFNKKGYIGTSLSDLTKVTGLTKGSIYGNFKNKEEVAIEVLKYNISLLTNLFNSYLKDKNSTIKKLLAYVEVYEEQKDTIFKMGGCPLLNALVDSDDTEEMLLDIAVDALNYWRSCIENVIKDGISLGDIKRSTDPQFISSVLISLFEAGGILSKSTKDNIYIKNNLKLARSIIEDIKN